MGHFDSWVIVGQIIKPFGVNGQLKIRSFCENPLSIIDYNPLLIEGTNELVYISKDGIRKDTHLIVRIPSLRNKEAAEKLIGRKIFANRKKFSQLSDYEFYFSDLENCVVYDNITNKAIGKVQAIHNFGAGELLEISKFEDNTSLILHFNKENFPVVEIKLRKIIVNSSRE